MAPTPNRASVLLIAAVLAVTLAILRSPYTTNVGTAPTAPTAPTSLAAEKATAPPALPPAPAHAVGPRDYPLAALLNVPAFKRLPAPALDAKRIESEAGHRPDSILARYAARPNGCASVPSAAALRHAAGGYYESKYTREHFKIGDSTLVVHHDPAKLDHAFLDAAVGLAAHFLRVRLLVPDPRMEDKLKKWNLVVHNGNSTDDRVAFMQASIHLLVHTGELSALGALVATGTVYHTDALGEYTTKNAFKWMVKNRIPLSPEKFTPYLASLSAMGPVRPTCCDFQPFGKGDEEKIVCANAGRFTSPCWILAVGSAGRFGFETDVLTRTKCQIHTFDCTGSWKVPENLASRVTLHRLCLGNKNEGLFRTWGELVRIGSDALAGTTGLTMPSFTKIDIEGYEFPVIEAMVQSDEETLPQQIAMEVHKMTGQPVGYPYVRTHPKERRGTVSDENIAELFRNLSKVGYDLVHRADNPFCPHCSEVTLVRRSVLPSE